MTLTPGELPLDAGYRQCLLCGRLMRDGIPSRHMTDEERSTFKPCASVSDVCAECQSPTPNGRTTSAHLR